MIYGHFVADVQERPISPNSTEGHRLRKAAWRARKRAAAAVELVEVAVNWKWLEKAACRGKPSDLFFPGKNPTAEQVASAKAICAACQVKDKCLAAALATREPGIWGGTTKQERNRIRRRPGRPRKAS